MFRFAMYIRLYNLSVSATAPDVSSSESDDDWVVETNAPAEVEVDAEHEDNPVDAATSADGEVSAPVSGRPTRMHRKPERYGDFVSDDDPQYENGMDSLSDDDEI